MINLRRGFTIIELLSVIAIIAVLAAILVPVTRQVWVEVRAMQSASNLRQIHAAAIMYAQNHYGRYPDATNTAYSKSWHYNAELQKYLGYEPTESEWESKVCNDVLPVMQSPLVLGIHENGGNWSYGANYNAFGYYNSVSAPNGNKLEELGVDTPSKTIMYGEANDWQIAYWARKSWTPKDDERGYAGGSRCAYRYKGKCLAVTFGGNVVSFDMDESDKKSLWNPRADDQ